MLFLFANTTALSVKDSSFDRDSFDSEINKDLIKNLINYDQWSVLKIICGKVNETYWV
jgi:methionyl-tRNA synthetase